MKTNSLAFRLAASSAVIACVLLITAGLLLNDLFQQALERNFDARLRAVMDGVIGNVELSPEGKPQMAGPIADTRFELPMSGWYWQVAAPDQDPGAALASASLLEKRLQPTPADLATRDGDGAASFYIRDSEGKQLRAIEQKYSLFGSKTQYSFIVAGNFDELSDEVTAFRRIMWLILGLLGLGLLAATLAQVRFGLRPMQELQQKLNDIRSGKSEMLEGRFPSEMQPVANEMNLLIKTGFEVLDRARTQVGNLAHALKTPLSVLTNEAAKDKSPLGQKVVEQTEVMRDQISLYLDRARRAAAAQSIGAVTDVEPVLQALARTLQRINQDKAIAIEVTAEQGLRFRGEQQDLEEMIGNLLDNACKWSRGKVTVTANKLSTTDSRSWLEIAIADDGPGIAAEKRELAMKRGQRLDETKPGSGLGLNIVVETSAMYGGILQLETSQAGGLLALLKLPAVS
jgi:signal transduction histidine kinase